MRKQLLALLSVFGLAGSSTPASAQVLKGSKPADTKSESTIKQSKTAQEDAASKDAQYLKGEKNTAETNAAKKGATKKVLIGLSEPKTGQNDKAIKMRKAGGEQSAATAAGEYKDRKSVSAMGDGSVRTSATGGAGAGKVQSGGGGGAGKVAMHDIHIKGEKSAAETKAVQQDASKKARKQVDQASPK